MNLERELKRFVRQIRPGLIGATSNPNRNLNYLIEELKSSAPKLKELNTQLEEFLPSRDFVIALTETGLTLETGVFGEVFKRLEYKILPKPVESSDILSFLSRVFDAQSDAGWLERIDRQRFGELLALLLPDKEKLIESLAPQVFMSLDILSLRLAGLGYDPLVTGRLRSRREYQHAFMDVTRKVHALLDGKEDMAFPEIREALARCSGAVDWIRSRRGIDGVSMALTYRLMKIQQIVERMELVLELIESILNEWLGEPALKLFFELNLAEVRRFNLRSFVGGNVELLAYQITEHTGKTGEHYITKTRSEWKYMFKSAAIGGTVVGCLVIGKFLLSALHLAVGPQAFAYGLLYSAGFILLHHLGGTLATKQPAMTANTLAASLDGAADSLHAMKNLSEVIVCTIRSQMIALLGNYLFAFPIAALICWPLNMINHPLMDSVHALNVLNSLHPWKSLSFFYAALAGVGLFGSGLIAGFADNWFIFNHVGSRLKESEMLRKLVGPHNLHRAIHSIDRNLGFWVGNTGLGFYLGSMAAIGEVLGLPLDVRHITFSSGQLGTALSTLRFQIPLSLFATLAISIFCMGLINLAVSFSLSLFVAIKSRKIRFSQTPLLLRMIARHFREHPQDFFYPPQESK